MRKLVCLSLFCVFASGCGEFAYKRGATAKDFDATKKNCQSADNEAAIEKCLADSGWVVQKLDALGLPDSELFATASVSEDNRNPMQTLTTQTEGSQTEVASSEAKQINNEKESVSKAKPTLDGSVNKSDSVIKDTPINAKVAADTPKKEAPPAKNPLEKYKINSWWKMGGGRDALDLSMETCSKRLGDAHLPDRKNQIFTRAFAACMYENGWRGLREK